MAHSQSNNTRWGTERDLDSMVLFTVRKIKAPWGALPKTKELYPQRSTDPMSP